MGKTMQIHQKKRINSRKMMKLLKNSKKQLSLLGVIVLLLLVISVAIPGRVAATDGIIPDLEENSSSVVNIILILTVLSIAPSILLMMTCFTRIIIVLSFTRSGLGAQQMPPNQVLIGLALFLTLFIMEPVISQVNKEAYKPLIKGEITTGEALKKGVKPIREFMLKNTSGKDLNLFIELSGKDTPETYDEISLTTIIPAFTISELKRGFQMGFFILIPFIVIDMIVSSTLMSMGMMMLPPTMISLPFKILLFILVDGWSLTVKTLVRSFGS